MHSDHTTQSRLTVKKSSPVIRWMREHLKTPVTAILLASLFIWTGGRSSFAATTYRNNTGANTTLDTSLFTPAAPGAIIQNYANGNAFTAGDIIAFNNAITAATTFRISATTGTNLQVGGLTIGNLFNGALLNPGGAITIQNGAGASGAPVANTLTIGASGIDMTYAGHNLTISQDTTNGSSLLVTTSADQTWTNRTGRTVSLAAAPLTLAHNLTLQGAGTTTFGGNATGPISGSGNMIINGSQSGGATVVNLGGTNTGWTGAVTVGSSSHLRTGVTLNLDQSVAGQNKLADGQTLTINHATVNLLGTGGGTETVAGVSLGQGLNVINRSAGTGVLQANTITFGAGAALNVGNIGTVAASSWLTTDNLNNNLILGGRMVSINGTTDTNWVKNATNAADGAVIAASGADYTTNNALDTWTTATQNILMTATGTASTASRTINSLKIAHTTAATAVTTDIGAGNTLTINDGFNGGGIIRNQNGATTIGAATVGQGSITAGAVDDSINDTLFLWNSQNIMSVNMVIKDNNTGVGTDTLHLVSGGAGTVTINADNTFTGGTTIAAGTLNVGGNAAASDNADLGTGAIVNHGTLVFNKSTAASDAQNTFANNITGTGAVTIARDVVTLSGNNDYAGLTTIATNTTLRAGSTTGLSTNSCVFLSAAGATLDLNGFDSSVASLRSDTTTTTVALGTNTLTLSGSDLANSGNAETMSLGAVQNYQGAFSATAGNLIKNGLYTQVFTVGGAAAYTGTTTVNAGTLQTNKALATSALTINNSTPSLLGGGSLFISNIANSLTSTTAVNLANIGSTWQINNGFNQTMGSLAGVTDSRVFLQGGAGNIVLTINDNGGSPTVFNGVINAVSGTGVGSVVKEGTNTWVLGGGNSFGGGLTINGGIVQVAASNAIGVLGDLVPVTLADVAGVALDINGNAGSIGSLAGGGATGGNVTLGAAGTLTTGYNNTSTSFGGAISGGTSGFTTLTKLGTGTQTLTGTNTFLGNVQIGNVGGQSGGGLTIGVGGSLADTVNVRNSGWNTTFGVDATDTVGAVTGTRNTTLALGTGAVLTSTYTDGTPTALAATADSAAANGRIVRDIDTSLLKVGDLISGTTGITAGSYVVQIIDNNTVLVNLNVPTGPTTNFVPTVTSTSVLNSALTGLGGFTKDGAGTLILTGNSNHSGATTINAGTVQIGGIWNGQKFSLHDTLSDASQLTFAGTGTQTLNFASSTTNLQSFERIGSLAGGSATSTINLTTGANVAVLALGADNTSTTYSGTFLPGNSAGWIIKEGTGNFTWSNSVANVFDGTVFVDNGTITSAGAEGFDGANQLYLTNRGTTLVVNETGGDSISFLQGGKGDARIILGTGTQPVGGLTSNYLTTVAPIVTLTTGLTVSQNTAPNLATLAGVYTFNGDIQGAATLVKSGAHLWRLMGTSTNAFTGETQITAGTLQTGVLSRGAGVGAISGSDIFGTLSTGTGLRLTGGTLDINSTAQTVLRINATSTGGTIQLVNGSLTLSNQNTQTTATVLTGNLNSVLNLNAASAATLSLTGNSTGFGGSINVGTNAALTLNRAGGALNSTGIPAARVNLNGTGTQLTVTLADTIGSLAGTGNAVLTQGLTIREGWSGSYSGSSLGVGYGGATSGAGALILSNYGGLTLSGNNAHTGGTTVSSSALLNLNYGAGNNILPATGALTLNGGRIQIFTAAGPTPTLLESVASTSLNAGASNISSWLNFTADTPTIQGGGIGFIGLGTITRAVGGMLNVNDLNTVAVANTNTNGIIGGWFTLCESTWGVYGGAATSSVTGLTTYSADVFGAGLHVDITAAGANAGGLADTLRFSGANATDITGATTIATGGILNRISVGANTSTISGALDATDNELKIHQYNTLGDLILSNVVGTNTVITTAGGGKTLITNDIAGTGGANIGYGYLQLGSGGATGTIGTGIILNNGTLGINRSTAVTLAAISGTGNIEQLGAGTTTLGGTNSFAGRVTVRNGTLEVISNAGLGLAATSPTNRWANLTSVNTGGTLLLNVTAGGALTEVLNLDGGTLDIRSTAATTLGAPIILTSDSTIHVSNPGAAVSHIITGEIYALPGSDLSFTGVGGATPSTLILNPAATTGSRWENTSVGAGAIVQVGTLAGARGFVGTGNISIAAGGTLAFSTNDNYVISNNITGAGTLALNRNANYLTGDLSGFSGTLLITPAAGQNVNVSGELGNDTYGNSFGTGPITVTASASAGTSGIASVRTHFNQDITMSNTINLNPANDATNAKNAQFLRNGLGNVTLDGTINLGVTTAGTGAQRNLIQTEAGGKLFLNATLAGGGASNLLNIVNNNIIVFGGSVSNTYSGILSGNNVWVYNNSGTTTLSGVNTVNSGSNYIRQGTVSLTGGAASNDDNDWQVLSGGTLNIAATETIGALYMQRGSITNVAAGQTLTVDDGLSQLIAGQLTGAGNLTLGGGNFMAMYPAVANTISGNLQLGVTTTGGAVASTNLTNALGSFGTITLGVAGNTGTGGLEYTGPGETFAKNITLAGTGSNYITANGNGALILSGNITATGATSTLRLIGQTGGYFNPITNRVDGIISDGANVLAIAMTNSGDDDRFGITGRWALTNASNDFSGAVTVNVGMLELAGDLKTGVETTTVLGDLSATRTITLGSNNFNGRRYDMFGNTDQLGDAGFSQGTNTLTPSGDVGTIIFNDTTGAGTVTFGANISWSMVNTTTTNTTGAQLINNGTKNIIINGTFATNTTGNHNIVLDGSNTLSNQLNSALANPATSQTTAVIKEGAGTWRLGGANTYTGATTINNGILELAGGAAIADSATVAINGDGSDGLFSGTAKLRVFNSETIGNLTGRVLTEAEIVAGQTLTIAAGANATMNGLITGGGNLTRVISGTTGGTLTTSAKNTYAGITTLGATGTATANAGISITHLANGGVASGIGAGTAAATDLVFTTNTAGTNGGVLTWTGMTNQSTDRLFTMGLGVAGATIAASGTLLGTMQPSMSWTNVGSLAYTGSGARTLTLTGTGIVDNVFRPQIIDSGGLTTLSKTAAGLWLINPDVAGNTYTGGTSITGGTLAIQAGNALGSGLITINGAAGTGLELRSGVTLANAITNSTAEGGIIARSGVNVATGLATLTANIRIAVDSGASLEFNNATSSITGAGLLQKFGAGNLILSGVNGAGFTGATLVRGGTLTLEYGTNNTSKLADAGVLTLGTAGGVTLPGVDNEVAGQSNLFGTSGGAIVLSGGSHVEQVASTTLAQGASSISRSGGTSTINLENITRAAASGATIDLGAASIATTNNFNGVQNATAAHNILNTTGGAAGTHTGAFATINKTDWATTAAAGTDIAITAIAAGAYNNGGAIEVFGAGFNTDVISAAAAPVGAFTGTIRFNLAQASTLTLPAAFGATAGVNIGLQSGGILVTPNVGAFDSIINSAAGAFLQNGVITAADLIIHQHNTLGALQIDSVIRDNTVAQGVTKTGAGKLFLSALTPNLQTGAFNINQGEVQVGGTAAAPTTATTTTLGGANVAINMSEGATLRFLSSNATVQDLSTVQGGGSIIMDVGNTMPVLMDTDNANYFGSITVNQGTLQVAAANGLGSNRGITTIGALGTLQMNTAVNSPELITYLQGATVAATATGGATLSGKQTFSNTTTGGLTFNIAAPTTAGTVGINVSGIAYGSSGFTKTGNGILQVSANNFTDVYDGYTGINDTPSLSGQIAVNAGILYVGGARALGAHGAGNEVIVASGASLDLRGNALNYGDDSDLVRKLIQISGTGFVNAQGNNTGALRNTTGTGQTAHLKLDASSLINSGGQINASALIIGTFDSNLSNANGLTGAFTRNAPVIDGGGFDLTIQGGRIATDNFVIADPSFSSALGSLIIREGGSRLRHEVSANIGGAAGVAVTAANITGGIEIGYGGLTAADLIGVQVGGQGNTAAVLGANVGARFLFENWYGTHHTVNLSMNGTLAATATGNPGGARSLAGGQNYLQADFFTIPDGTTYLDGTLSLTGTANRNLIFNDSVGNYSVVEQGNTTVSTVTKLVFGGVASGTGGFSKEGQGDVRFTANNTFSGDVNVLRFGFSSSPFDSHTYKINGVDYATNGLGEGWAERSLTLNGANGAFSDVGNINLQRRGMLTLDNTTRLAATSGVAGGNNNNRIADDAVINMEHGWLRINAGTVANTETLDVVNINSGTNMVDLYGTDGANVNNILTINTLNRTAGGTVRFTNLDATSTFASAAGPNDSTQVAVGVLGAGAALSGGAGAANSTTMSIAQGVFGGNAPIDLTTDFRVLGFNNGNITDLWNQQRNLQFATGSHFMTLDGGFLRPLDNDEYFTATTGVINPTTLGNTNQNVNLSDVFTIMSQDSTINALRLGALTDHDGTGATGLIDHHGINLMVDGTLKINSGMISSAYWTVGNTSSATTQIWGGALDMNGKEAIINNQNAFYRTTDGIIVGGDLFINSAITNATGLTKTGFQRVNLGGANTYTGLTTITEGVLDGRHGRSSFGVGGVGNGIVVLGTGELRTNNGIQVGTAAAREDIYVGILAGEQQVMRVESDLTQWFSNVTIDNVDAAGHPIFTPRIRTDNSATSIIMGDIAGGDTLISNDVLAHDSRVVQFDSTGNNVFIMRGQFGDRYVAGVAAPIADPISLLPTLAGTRTNENEVLRVNLAGGSDETNLILDRNYNAAGRLTIARGTLIANYDPAAADGAGFWTAAAISKIPNADSVTTAFNINGSTAHQGFILGTTGNTYGAIMLARPNQVFNMATWQTLGTGTKFIGGLNESGTVTYGDGTGSLQHGDNGGTTGAGAIGNLYAADGGTVVFQQRMIGNIGTIANQVFGFLKQGRGTVELQNSSAGAGTSAFVLAGGTLVLNHTAATNVAVVGNTNARFDGGTVIVRASSSIATTEGFATADAAGRILEFSIGGTEIVARTTSTGTPRNMTLGMGNPNANGTTPASNFLRGLGATANLVEDNAAGGTAQITLNFNATTTAAVKNQIIPWATYGTLSRTATDFAMSDAGNANDVRSYTRALDEYNNNVATWAANQDVSENGGAGFNGSLAAPLTLSTLRFDANADSTINLGTNVLTVAGNGLATSGGGILVSSNVGSSNKTITGGVGAGLTTSGGRVELILHHYGTGNLNVNVPITGAGVDLVVAGPSTTNATTIGTTGAVVLGATNTYDGQTFINGSVLSISNVNQLGTNATASAIVMNGGTLRYTGTGLQSLGTKGIEFQGNGGTLDITDGAGELYLDTAIISNALYRGDLIKVGAGTLTLNGALAAFGTAGNPGFNGLIDVRQGTLRLAVDHGNNTAGNETSEFTTAMGSSNSYMDGTVFRTGTNFAIQMGNANDAGGYSIGEWLTFEGNNYVSVGTINSGVAGNTADTAGATELSSPVPNPNNRRPVNLNGVNTINGTVTFDVVAGQTLRLNNGGVGYTTGNGTIIKDGQGIMMIGTNIPDFTGAITILQGRFYAQGQADVLGTGYTAANGNKVITLGSADRQGIAELAPTSDNIAGATFELNHNVNVVYNPAQTKRLLIETFANGSQIELNGNITLNDNLQVYINDAAETGGTTNYVNMNGKLLDGATTSGNLVFTSDDTGNANDNTNGRTNHYLVLRNDNSGWTGDVRVSIHTGYDQDENAILRLEAGNALGAANDVDMGFNSILQVGGSGSSGISGATSGNRTIGSLSTNGGTGPFIGGTAGGTMGSTNNGTSVIIENAATTAGTLVITQSTPVSTEVQWNAHFRDGTLNSEFFAPGATTAASAALNIVKAGGGWATLSVDNDHTGSTTVSGGILQVGRAGVGDTGRAGGSANRFTADVATTVAGTGTIQGNTAVANSVLLNGNVKPGDEAGSLMGTLVINGNTTLGATSVTTFQGQRASYTAMNQVGFDNAAYGTWLGAIATDTTYSHMMNDPVTTAQHDKIIVTGGLTTNAGAKIVLTNNGYTPTAGDVFNLLDWVGALTGTWSVGGTAGLYGGLIRTGAETGTDLDLFELGGNFRWDVSQFNTSGFVVVVVPEPSRLMLLMLGLLGLCVRRRRRA